MQINYVMFVWVLAGVIASIVVPWALKKLRKPPFDAAATPPPWAAVVKDWAVWGFAAFIIAVVIYVLAGGTQGLLDNEVTAFLLGYGADSTIRRLTGGVGS